jgi:hypothetical protein
VVNNNETLTPEEHAGLNYFAQRAFLEIADGDYIAARSLFEQHLWPQFFWARQQTFEKLLKCTLLLNRVKASQVGHDLDAALAKVRATIPALALRESTEEIVKASWKEGADRYFSYSDQILGAELIEFDRSVWELRQYCSPWLYAKSFPSGSGSEPHSGGYLSEIAARIRASKVDTRQKPWGGLRFDRENIEQTASSCSEDFDSQQPILWAQAQKKGAA